MKNTRSSEPYQFSNIRSQNKNEILEDYVEAIQEILKNKDDQIKNISNEIINITKLTVGKIADIELSDNDLNKVIETQKGSFN